MWSCCAQLHSNAQPVWLRTCGVLSFPSFHLPQSQFTGRSFVSFLRPLGESVDHFQDSGPFDQTPTSLPSFLTSLTSNVWHSRLAVDQLCTPRQGPTGPGQMPLHVGPDHMNVGRNRGPWRTAPPTRAASHHSLKINSRKDIKGHPDQRAISCKWGFFVLFFFWENVVLGCQMQVSR